MIDDLLDTSRSTCRNLHVYLLFVLSCHSVARQSILLCHFERVKMAASSADIVPKGAKLDRNERDIFIASLFAKVLLFPA